MMGTISPYSAIRHVGGLNMRYALLVLGAIGLGLGFLMFANAHHPDHVPQATIVIQLGGIFLAAGMATTDIVESIRNNTRS
jgi:hypothetical protein